MTNQTPQSQQPDTELLERFILGRVTDSERAKIESMLAGNPEWREALRREQLIAAGARRLGRDNLRERLATRVGRSMWISSPWIRYSAIAASVMLVVGVTLYTFIPSPSPPKESPAVARSQRAITPESPSGAEAGIDGKRPADKDLLSAESRIAEKAPAPPEPLTKSDAPDRTDSSPTLAAKTPPASGIAGKATTLESPGPEAQGSEFWTEGTTFPDGEKDASGRGEAEAKNETIRMQQRARAKGERSAETQAQLPSQTQQYTQKLIIVQRPLQDADARLQAQASTFGEGHIPTFVRIGRDTLSMTLYLARQFEPSLVESARIEPAGGDSVVLTVGNRRIGYNFHRRSPVETPKR